jgi:pyruvate formate lyase activating enzyme
LNAHARGLDERGHCVHCGKDAHFKFIPKRPRTVSSIPNGAIEGSHHSFDWHGDIRSLHVQLINRTDRPLTGWYRHRSTNSATTAWSPVEMKPGESWRFIIAKSSPDDLGAEIVVPEEMTTNLHEVFDRAHFPTVRIEDAPFGGDVSPFPIYERHPERAR